MKPEILLGVETLQPGGAEAFVLRLANGLASHYHVRIFVVYGDKIDQRFISRQKPRFDLEAFSIPFDWFIRKADSLLSRLRIDFGLRDFFVRARLRKILSRGSVTVLHSHQFKVDYVFCQANSRYNIPHFTTIHGDYINFYQRIKKGTLNILNFPAKVSMVLSQLNGIAYISDHQLQFMSREFGAHDLDKKVHKIYNGLESHIPGHDAALAFTKKNFVFGMVARAIPEKGWECAIQAFLQLGGSGNQLVLVGEGEYLDTLKQKYDHPEIYFVGYSNNPMQWISHFDVGLLPTTFPSESLPTTVIEYLMMGKPVVATEVGEIRNMINQHGTSSGILLSATDGKVSVNECAGAMRKLLDDKRMYNELSLAAKEHAKAFDMEQCIVKYLNLYEA